MGTLLEEYGTEKEPSIDEYDVEDDDSEVIASRGIVGAPEAVRPIPLKNKAMVIIEKKKEEEARIKAEEEEKEKERLRLEAEEEERRLNDPEY
jgi:hypothetical protein